MGHAHPLRCGLLVINRFRSCAVLSVADEVTVTLTELELPLGAGGDEDRLIFPRTAPKSRHGVQVDGE